MPTKIMFQILILSSDADTSRPRERGEVVLAKGGTFKLTSLQSSRSYRGTLIMASPLSRYSANLKLFQMSSQIRYSNLVSFGCNICIAAGLVWRRDDLMKFSNILAI